MTETRLNARLDAELSRKLGYLRTRTHLSTTEIVRLALERYYESVASGQGQAKAVLTQCGFVGVAEGPRDLSERYKDELTASLDPKVR